jgi:hypothetical protein
MNTMRATKSNMKKNRLLYTGPPDTGTGSNGDIQYGAVAKSLVLRFPPNPGGRLTPRVCLYSPIIDGGGFSHVGLQHPGLHGWITPSCLSIHPQNVPDALGRHMHLVSHIHI